MLESADLDVDCLATGLLGGLAAEYLRGAHRDLLAPLRFLPPGQLPTASASAVDRSALAHALATTNAAYGHPRATELAARLADPATRVVATGQQTGLFGGPLLGVVKAAAAVRYAEALAARGEPAVAVFWMATEDHDWAEVSEAAFPTRDGLRRLALGADPQPLAPVGMRTAGAAVVALVTELAELYPQLWARAELHRLAGFWRPEARFGEAFARQLVATFGARAPLLLDAMLPELKRAERPQLRALVERRDELARAFAERERELAARGFAPQVPPAPGASPLFLLRDRARRRIEWRDGEHFALRGVRGSRPLAELFATIEENPAAVSPGALARPALQDAALGTTLQVLGPGELAYMAQAAAVYETLGIAPPGRRSGRRPSSSRRATGSGSQRSGSDSESCSPIPRPPRAGSASGWAAASWRRPAPRSSRGSTPWRRRRAPSMPRSSARSGRLAARSNARSSASRTGQRPPPRAATPRRASGSRRSPPRSGPATACRNGRSPRRTSCCVSARASAPRCSTVSSSTRGGCR
jgi:hypothetical protein